MRPTIVPVSWWVGVVQTVVVATPLAVCGVTVDVSERIFEHEHVMLNIVGKNSRSKLKDVLLPLSRERLVCALLANVVDNTNVSVVCLLSSAPS